MNDFLTFLSVALPIYTLIVYIIACSSLAKTAEDKGHKSSGLGFACFFLGVPYMIWVASLPDLKVRAELGIVEEVSVEKTKTISQKNNGWKCAFCGRVNSEQSNGCMCGKTKTESVQKSVVEHTLPTAYWECPSCKAKNANYVGTCSCGTRKPRK